MTATTLSARPAPRLGRHLGAVLAGLVAIFVLTTAVDVVLHLTGVFPPMDAPPMSDALFALAFGYRLVLDVAGCWLTARLAPNRPMTHALALGGLGTLLSVAGALAMGDRGPAWYSVGLAVSALPSAWLGAWLHRR